LHGGGQRFDSPRIHFKKVVDLQTKYAKCGNPSAHRRGLFDTTLPEEL
jgi:hypothetical protein